MIINGKTYRFPELTFNAMCELEDIGVSLTELEQKPMTMIRGFLALAVGSLEKAGRELESHVINGGNFDDVAKEIKKAVDSSGFFQALASNKDKGITARGSKEKNPK